LILGSAALWFEFTRLDFGGGADRFDFMPSILVALRFSLISCLWFRVAQRIDLISMSLGFGWRSALALR
jgi:hypothetical protein